MTASNTEKSALRHLRPIFRFLLPYKWVVAAALFALVLTAGINLSLGQGLKQVIDQGFIAGSMEQLRGSVLLLIGLIALLAVGIFCRFYLMSWLGERVSSDLRKAVFARILALHPSYFEENRSGEIMSRLTTDTTLLQSIVGSSLSMALRSTLMLIGGVIMLFITNVKLTLIVLLCVPMVLLPMKLFGRRVRTLASSSQDAIADISTYAGEVMQNIKTVHSFNRQGSELAAFDGEVDKAFAVAKKRIMQRSFLIAFVIFISFSGISFMLYSGGVDVLSGQMSGGELAAFVFYAIVVAMAVGTVAEIYGELQRAAGAAKRLLELLEVQSDIIDPAQPQSLDAQIQTKVIEFNDVSFHYPSRPQQSALSAFNLDIAQGETVAIVGPSGAGKSTLFELLQRFYDVSGGSIRLHGTDIRDLTLHDIRAQMAMVAQHPVLFSADVYHNIAYGKEGATQDEVSAAAKQAYADEFIKQLPDGYHSFLGERGVRLSGGQKQRIAIARAILKDPDILLLDEATSALDAQSEYHVQAALTELMKSRTTLIIAHRLSTVMHADRIVVMDQGKVVASGDHASLMQQSPLYQKLCELQFNQPSASA
ncbi:ABC transporter transmembrane domain-containing protein [Pseudoalteromonas sp. BDTF-M6]|uniref:ABC transporter transmembrane domain-containing protein n=1 Tax=Pseudoalteromonas sp. BDTF-M6 TaxID=2796132 RepID=UPI001BAEEA44|nr:ABC transporter transmembrane domain-containing protein [Pseudoalteromonas sp. BDTF-M6]MBS3799241.1 ATP-binding cassette domain-containing protein [Pseudoalteromonas sp. BDTF-M6]